MKLFNQTSQQPTDFCDHQVVLSGSPHTVHTLSESHGTISLILLVRVWWIKNTWLVNHFDDNRQRDIGLREKNNNGMLNTGIYCIYIQKHNFLINNKFIYIIITYVFWTKKLQTASLSLKLQILYLMKNLK